jgi:hypothetical protein
MAVDPQGHDLKNFLQAPETGPVVTLNLLRFTPDGRASYARYARYGAEVIHAMAAGAGPRGWSRLRRGAAEPVPRP